MVERIPTEDDFKRILAGILPASISPDAQASMEAGIKEYLMQDLADQPMTEEDMEQLAFALAHHFKESLVSVGEAVGPLAALSTGEPATQMQLSAHRVVGTASKTTNEGIPRFQELLRATVHQKAISMSIYFWKRQTLGSIRQLAPRFVYRTLADFLELDGAQVGSTEELPASWWQEEYRILQNYRAPAPTYIARLRLNRDEILRYGLTPDAVVEKLKASYPVPVYVYSPIDEAIIDVHAQPPLVIDSAPYISQENALLYYLRDTLIPALRDVHMTGIPKITAAFPRQQELSTFITTWNGKRVTMNSQKARMQGVEPADLLPLLEAAGYEPQKEMEGDEIILGVGGGNPGQLNERILAKPELSHLNGTWYLETNGSNLAEVLAMDIVNNEVTFCTDVTEIYTVFGIQAARDYLLEQFISILSSDSYMDPRHLILLADVMTNVGLLAPATSAGVSRQRIGPLTRAAFERPVEHFLLAAGFGEVEEIRGVAASVFAGKLANIGPSAFERPSLQTVEEGQDELDEEKVPETLVLPETLELEEAVAPVTAPTRVLATKTSMYPPRRPIGAAASVPPPAARPAAPAAAPVDVVLPDTLTLDEALPVASASASGRAPAPAPAPRSALPPRRSGLPAPVFGRRAPVPAPAPEAAELPAELTLEPAAPIGTSTSAPPVSKPLPRRRF
jgi:hypothetical protein